MPRKRKDPPAAIALPVTEVVDGVGDLGLPVAVALEVPTVVAIASDLNPTTPRANATQALPQAGGKGALVVVAAAPKWARNANWISVEH